MAYEYCCFVSYPHGQNNVLVPLVQKIVEALKNEVGAQLKKGVWLDHEHLQGGQLLDSEIAYGLCKSACMIMIYTPLYFDSEHVYCARELKAMQELEERRLAPLANKNNRLIIPIILRGEKKYPLQGKWVYHSFTDIEMNDPIEQIPIRYAKKIREIAEYIVDRCQELDASLHAVKHDCEQYSLPTIEDTKLFVESIIGKKMQLNDVPFVGRSN
jgi:hypothetical protein